MISLVKVSLKGNLLSRIA